MTITVAPTETDVVTALRSFLTGFLPSATAVIMGQVNRVPEPAGSDYVVMTPIRRSRIETNVDDFVDTRFTASIAGTELTITAVSYGAVKVGSAIFGVDVAAGTTITAFVSGGGGVGTYTVSDSQTVAEEVMAAGVWNVLQPTEVTIQIDAHGPSSADNAQMISTLLRSDYGVQAFGVSGAVPLYAGDPRQLPFLNAEQQYENRWSVDAVLQANETVLDIPQQFAESVVVGLIDVDAAYPPS